MAPSNLKRGSSNAGVLHNLPPNVMYVPADILNTLMRKIGSGEAITREEVFRVLPNSVASRDVACPIYVHPMDCVREFSDIEFYATSVEPCMWCWLVKRLLRECGKVPVARIITNARRVFLHLARVRKHRLDQLPASIGEEEWRRVLEQAVAGFTEDGRPRDPEDPDFWQGTDEIPLCGLTDEQRRVAEVITIDDEGKCSWASGTQSKRRRRRPDVPGDLREDRKSF